jgi:hypothetical protein
MRLHLVSLVFVVCALPLISPAGEKADHPLKKAKIGDYAVYTNTASENGKDSESVTVKKTVVARSDKDVTVRVEITAGGKTVQKNDNKIDLTKPYDPIAEMTAPGQKWEKIANGKEKIKIGAKSYDCTWISGKGTDAKKIEYEFKIWTDMSVPFGVVKMETKAADFKLRHELIESGSAK